MRTLAITAALLAGLGSAHAGPIVSLNNVSVAAGDITYVPFYWNGDNDGFTIGTSDSSRDPELFLLNASGSAVLTSNDDRSWWSWESLLEFDGAAGNYWLAIGNYNTTSTEALAGSNPGGLAFITDLTFKANDRSGSYWGDFTVGAPTSTLPTGRVPEPASLVLMGLGLFAAGAVSRRVKNKNDA